MKLPPRPLGHQIFDNNFMKTYKQEMGVDKPLLY